MFKEIFYKIFPEPDKRYLKKIQPLVEEINALEPELQGLSDEQLRQRAEQVKQGPRLPQAFALVREAAKRTLGQRHYDVQLMAGIVLHQGKIAEMQTGEGKTLAATLPAFLNALSGKGVHIVTVNDYLARRDTVWMGQIYHLLGLSVGCITQDKAYLYDPTHQGRPEEPRLPPACRQGRARQGEAGLGGGLLPRLDAGFPRRLACPPKPAGRRRGGGNPSTPPRRRLPLASQGRNSRDQERDAKGGFKVVQSYLRPVTRREAYAADITYGTNNQFGFDYLRDNLALSKESQVQRGFHYAILDEVDSILIDEARTPLIISKPDYEASELYKEVSRLIPKLKPEIDYETEEKSKAVYLTNQGIDHLEKMLGVGDIYKDKGLKYLHYIEQGLRAQVYFKRDRDYIVKNGRVVIVDEFTGRLMPDRRYSGGLHQALEAKEGLEVKPESKTLATITFQNLFRMYDKLAGMTGTAKTSAEEFDKVYNLEVVSIPTNKPMQRKALPDLVYKTQEAKFKAIVRDVKERHKKGQPILIGTNSIEKNEYLSKMLKREGIKHQVLNAKHHEKEGQIIAQAGRLGAVTVATNMAGRGVDIMLGGPRPQDDTAYQQWQQEHEQVKRLGGLHVIGAQRHEARRIDNQLVGRSGRQGDPGSSQFFVSLEDDLMRIFGGDKIKRIMNTLRVPEDQPIEARILSGAIERAQQRVEGMNFDIRHHLLEYDDVVNKHRQAVYSLRNRILNFSYEELKDYVLGVIRDELQAILEAPAGGQGRNENRVQVEDEIRTIMPLPPGSQDGALEIGYLMNIASNLLQQREKEQGPEQTEKTLRWVCLNVIDMFWTEQLDTMDHLRDSVTLQAYGGKDPLVEYKTQGHRIFKDLMANIRSNIARTIFKVQLTN